MNLKWEPQKFAIYVHCHSFLLHFPSDEYIEKYPECAEVLAAENRVPNAGTSVPIRYAIATTSRAPRATPTATTSAVYAGTATSDPSATPACLFVCGISLTSGQLINEFFPDCIRSCFSQVILRRRGGDRIYEMRCLFVAVGPNARFIVLPYWDNMS